MKNEKISFSKKINELIKILEVSESTDPYYLSSRLRKLRHYTLFVHNRIEQGMVVLITYNCIGKAKGSHETIMQIVTGHVRVQSLLTNISFSRKLIILKGYKIIDKKQMKMFTKLNTLRNSFAHISSKVFHKTDEDNYKSYKLLIKSLETMDEIITKQNVATSPSR